MVLAALAVFYFIRKGSESASGSFGGGGVGRDRDAQGSGESVPRKADEIDPSRK